MKIPRITNCRRIWVGSWTLSYGLLFTFSTAFSAEPYLPTLDTEVLERLPQSLFAGNGELRSLRQQLVEDPKNQELALDVAMRYLQIGNQEGDPRFYGYARSALQPWWETEYAQPRVLQLRAKLNEKDHQYDQALADLQLVTTAQPRNAQAWFETANIYRVQGKYDLAQAACDQLGQFAGDLQTQLCRIPILAVTGEVEVAYDSLSTIAPEAKQRWPEAVSWILAMQSQIAWSLGYEQQSQQHFRAGLANSPDDTYLLRTYADFLLDRGRNEEVLSLLREHINDNGILLRGAIAAKQAQQVTLAAQWQAQLESRFEEIRLRGDQPHGRFEARYELELNDNPQRALEIAIANWQKQKEARDTRTVLEAALAAEDATAARPVLQFLKQNKTQDVVLQKLAQQLEK